MSGDDVSKRIAEQVISRSSSLVYSKTVSNMTDFSNYYGVPFILISKTGILLELKNRKKIQFLPSINRTFTFYGTSMFLNFAYDEDMISARDQGKICDQNDFSFQPYQIFQLVQSKKMSSKSLLLFNCVMFQKLKCEPEWKIVNEFSMFSFKWKYERLSINYNNFNNCVVNSYMNIGRLGIAAIIEKRFIGKKLEMKGVSGEFFNLFAQRKNIIFKFDVTYDDTGFSSDRLFYNYELEYNVGWPYEIPHINHLWYAMEVTHPLLCIGFTFLVTPGTRLSPAENLYMPFDVETWISFGLSIAIGLTCITIVRIFPKSVQNFVFGRDNNDPILNLTQIFFGIGLIKVSRRNFARYLFMVFTLYCLIIRNAYQGKMFEFITGDLRHPTAKTIQDVFDMELPLILSNNPHILRHIG